MNLFQLGTYGVIVDLAKTKAFYSTLPQISANCSCGNCVYFEKVVIKQPLRLFDLLKDMQVDLSRQPDINPDGVYAITIQPNKINYHGYYLVCGSVENDTHDIPLFDSLHGFEDFEQADFSGLKVAVSKVDDEKVAVEFDILIEKCT